jgi:predicted O-methyltransferase YrrM
MLEPPLVERAEQLARELGFGRSSTPEVGRLLHVLAAQRGRTRVGELGTGAGVGTAWIASALRPGVPLFTVEADAALAAAARELFAADPDVHVLHGARSELEPEAPFDLLFVDAAKGEYARYIELAEPKLSERALLVVDNLLMDGEVALPGGADTNWSPDSLAAARALNAELMNSDRWLASVLPIGDGVGLGARL